MNERGGRGLEESKQSEPEVPVTGARLHAVLVDRAKSLDLTEKASQTLGERLQFNGGRLIACACVTFR